MINILKIYKETSQTITKRDIVNAALKLLGLYLLVFGTLDLIHKIIFVFYGGITYLSFATRLLGGTRIDWAGYFSTARDIISSVGLGKVVITLVSTEAFREFAWDLLRIFVGLYFCRRGVFFQRLLFGKEDVNNQSN